MAKHLWEIKNLRPSTIQNFNHIRDIAITEFGYTSSDANAIALYVSEMKRQKGRGIPMGYSSERGLKFIDSHSKHLIQNIRPATIDKYKEFWRKMNLESEREQI